MKRLFANLQKIEDFILVATFTVMVLASFAQVVNRNIIHAGVSWLEELARYCMVYMALLATEAGLRDNTQISITAITDKIHGMTGRVVRIISKAVVAIFSGVCFFSSFTILKTQLSSGQVSPGLHLPMAIPYFALTLSFGIITVIQAAALVCLVMEKRQKTKERRRRHDCNNFVRNHDCVTDNRCAYFGFFGSGDHGVSAVL